MTPKKGEKVLFPRWADRVVPMALAVAILGFAGTVFVFWYWFSPKNLDVGYQPKQPIDYSHRLHVAKLGLDCRYCHTGVETGAAAMLPTTEKCMNCHRTIKTDSPEIKKIAKSYATNTPIPWVKVHVLPDYTYFDHSRHVNSGVSCVTCHGRIDQMDQVHQVQPLSMGWCLNCHRNPEAFIRPKDQVTNMAWVSPTANLGSSLVKAYHIHPKEDCSVCHR